jgi:hypothetical protein
MYFCAPLGLPLLDISYKWNHINVAFYIRLFSSDIMFSRFIHIIAGISTLILWLHNTPFWILHHILFTYPSLILWVTHGLYDYILCALHFKDNFHQAQWGIPIASAPGR